MKNAPGTGVLVTSGCAWASTSATPTRKTTASTGKATRSKTCTRLWPNTAMHSVTTMARVRQRYGLQPVNVESASAPLMLFTASDEDAAIHAPSAGYARVGNKLSVEP
jgi:hypothetical protein